MSPHPAASPLDRVAATCPAPHGVSRIFRRHLQLNASVRRGAAPPQPALRRSSSYIRLIGDRQWKTDGSRAINISGGEAAEQQFTSSHQIRRFSKKETRASL